MTPINQQQLYNLLVDTGNRESFIQDVLTRRETVYPIGNTARVPMNFFLCYPRELGDYTRHYVSLTVEFQFNVPLGNGKYMIQYLFPEIYLLTEMEFVDRLIEIDSVARRIYSEMLIYINP